MIIGVIETEQGRRSDEYCCELQANIWTVFHFVTQMIFIRAFFYRQDFFILSYSMFCVLLRWYKSSCSLTPLHVDRIRNLTYNFEVGAEDLISTQCFIRATVVNLRYIH